MRKSARAPRSRRKCASSRLSAAICRQLISCSAQSTLTNKSRLKLLQLREEHLQDLFASSRAQILALAADEGRYTQFLQSVIVQGYLQLLEPEVTVLVREKDFEFAQQAADNAAAQYTEISGRTVTPTVKPALSNDMCVPRALISASYVLMNPSMLVVRGA